MAQDLANVCCGGFFLNIKVNQTVSFMTQSAIVEILIQREQCRPVQPME